jgi:hypothetical protein
VDAAAFVDALLPLKLQPCEWRLCSVDGRRQHQTHEWDTRLEVKKTLGTYVRHVWQSFGDGHPLHTAAGAPQETVSQTLAAFDQVVSPVCVQLHVQNVNQEQLQRVMATG